MATYEYKCPECGATWFSKVWRGKTWDYPYCCGKKLRLVPGQQEPVVTWQFACAKCASVPWLEWFYTRKAARREKSMKTKGGWRCGPIQRIVLDPPPNHVRQG